MHDNVVDEQGVFEIAPIGILRHFPPFIDQDILIQIPKITSAPKIPIYGRGKKYPNRTPIWDPTMPPPRRIRTSDKSTDWLPTAYINVVTTLMPTPASNV